VANEAGERTATVALWNAVWDEITSLRSEVDQHRATLGLKPRQHALSPGDVLPRPLEHSAVMGRQLSWRRALGDNGGRER
jgi:hypothetical protein